MAYCIYKLSYHFKICISFSGPLFSSPRGEGIRVVTEVCLNVREFEIQDFHTVKAYTQRPIFGESALESSNFEL